MENFDGPLGALAVTIFSQGLPKDTTIALVVGSKLSRALSVEIVPLMLPYIGIGGHRKCGFRLLQGENDRGMVMRFLVY